MYQPPAYALLSLQIVLLTAALTTCAAVYDRLRRMAPAARREALGVSAALFALAFAVRWVAAPHTLIHENHHGYDYVATAGMPLSEAALYHDVPSAHRLLVALLNRAFGPDGDPTFTLGVTLSALGVPGLFWLATRAFGSRRAGLAAASLLMFQPLALFLAPTEEPLNLTVATACAGMALLHVGASEGSRRSLAAGCALVAAAALARDVTLPLAALAPLAMLGARRSPRLPWWTLAVACAALGAALLPQLVSILGAMRSHRESSGLLSMPHLPFIVPSPSPHAWYVGRDDLWLGWATPYIPTWMGAAMCAAWIFLALRCALRRDLQATLLVVLAPLVGVLQGSLSHGWFPGGLRHGQFSMVLALLPVAGLADALAVLVPSRPRALAAAWLATPALCVVAAGVARFEHAPPLPIAAEYRLLRETVARMAPGDRFVTLPGRELRRFPATWVRSLRPDVWTVDVGQLRDSDRGAHWLVIDRVCSLDPGCFREPSSCQPGAPRRPPPRELLAEDCATALRAHPWRLVRRSVLCAASQAGRYSQPFDIPPRGRCAPIEVYRWSPD